MIGQTIRSLPLRWNSHPCFERNGARSLFSWMAGRSRLPFEFHPIPLLLSRESATNALRDRFAFWPVLADHGRLKKKKGKKKEIDYHSLELIGRSELPSAGIEFRAKMRNEAIFAAAETGVLPL